MTKMAKINTDVISHYDQNSLKPYPLQAQRVWFQAVLVILRVMILAPLVINRVKDFAL